MGKKSTSNGVFERGRFHGHCYDRSALRSVLLLQRTIFLLCFKGYDELTVPFQCFSVLESLSLDLMYSSKSFMGKSNPVAERYSSFTF